MLSDIRLAARLLLKHPALTAIAVVPLALGIGATAAVFSLIQGVLLTPPPYRQPDRLVLIPSTRADGRRPRRQGLGARTVDGVAGAGLHVRAIAAYGWTFNFLIARPGQRIDRGQKVRHERLFPPRRIGADHRTDVSGFGNRTYSSPTNISFSDTSLWRRTFNGDPKTVLKTVRMSGREHPRR